MVTLAPYATACDFCVRQLRVLGAWIAAGKAAARESASRSALIFLTFRLADSQAVAVQLGRQRAVDCLRRGNDTRDRCFGEERPGLSRA